MAIGILPCAAFPRGAGVAFKVIDGDPSGRARPVATIAVLRQLGVLTDTQVTALSAHATGTVNNMRGAPVGVVQADLELS
jgi:L-asparaginase II